MLVLMTPILAPIVAQAGIDPVHFGLVFVLSTMIGLITPPVGITMFIACQLAGITVNEFTRAVWRPFLVLVLVLAVKSDDAPDGHQGDPVTTRQRAFARGRPRPEA